MKNPFTHTPSEVLADIAEGRATAESSSWASHLSNCRQCSLKLDNLGRTMQLMKADQSVDAPRDLISYATSVFRRQPRSQPSVLRRVVAALSFDSSSNLSPSFAVRSSQSHSRQFIYSAEGHDIDLRISGEADQWVVSGQVLGGDCSGGTVNLENENGTSATTMNDLCEFRLPGVSNGRYDLRFRLPNLEIEISQLNLGINK